MRVLHVIPSIGPLRGGPGEAVKNVCRGLAQADDEVTLVTTDDNGKGHLDVPLGQPIMQDGYTVLFFRRSLRLYTFSWSLTLWLARHIHEYDFIHIHMVFSYPFVLAALLARLRGVPYSITPHGILLPIGIKARRTLVKRLHYALFEKRFLNNAAFVHVTSSKEAHELRALQVLRPIEMIHFGLDVPLFESSTEAKDALYNAFPRLRDQTIFLFLGRFHPIKGLDLLLPAFAQALTQAPHIVLALAGDGDLSYSSWLRSEVARLGLDEHVVWLGFLSGPAKWHALAASDVLVLPSYSESFGMVVIEAMACAKPVILSDHVAIHSEITQAQVGLVVTCQIEPLADAILVLACDTELRWTMGARGRQMAEAHFAVSSVVARLLDNYKRYSRRSVAH